MGSILRRTPQGIFEYKIAGTQPTEKELARITAHIASMGGQTAPAETEKKDTMDAIERGGESWLAAIETALGKTLSSLGAEETGKRLFESAEERRAAVQESTPDDVVRSYKDVGGISDALSYAATGLGETGVETTAVLGGMATGAGIGALPVFSVPTAGLSIPVFSAVGGFIAGYPSYVGHNLERQMDEGKTFEETSLGTAAATAVPQAALNVAIGRFFPGMGRAAATQTIWSAAKRTAGATGTEGLTESAQQALEIAQANPEKLLEMPPEVQEELWNAAILGGVLGGGIGGVSAGAEAISARRQQRRKDERQEELRRFAAEDASVAEDLRERAETLKPAPVGQLTNQQMDRGNPRDAAVAIAAAPATEPLFIRETNGGFRVQGESEQIYTPVLNTREDAQRFIAFNEENVARIRAEQEARYEEALRASQATQSRAQKQATTGDLARAGQELQTPTRRYSRDEVGPFLAGLVNNRRAPGTDLHDFSVADLREHAVDPIKEVVSELDGRIDALTKALTKPKGKKKLTPAQKQQNEAVQEQIDQIKKLRNTEADRLTEAQKQIANVVGIQKPVTKGEGVIQDPTVVEPQSVEEPTMRPAQQVAMPQEPITLPESKNQRNVVREMPRKGGGTEFALVDERVDNDGNVVGSAPVATFTSPEAAYRGWARRASDEQLKALEEEGVDPKRPNPYRPYALKEIQNRERGVSPEKAERIERLRGLRNALRAVLNSRGLSDVGLRLQEALDGVEGVPAEGQYEAIKNLISLSTGIYDPNMSDAEMARQIAGILNHESLHALRALGLFSAKEWDALVKASKVRKMKGYKHLTYEDGARQRYGGLGMDEEAIVEEGVAEMFREWAQSPRNVTGQPNGLFRRIVNLIRKLVSAQYRSGLALDSIFGRVESGEIGSRARNPLNEVDTKYSLGRANAADGRFDVVNASTGRPVYGTFTDNGERVPVQMLYGTHNPNTGRGWGFSHLKAPRKYGDVVTSRNEEFRQFTEFKNAGEAVEALLKAFEASRKDLKKGGFTIRPYEGELINIIWNRGKDQSPILLSLIPFKSADNKRRMAVVTAYPTSAHTATKLNDFQDRYGSTKPSDAQMRGAAYSIRRAMRPNEIGPVIGTDGRISPRRPHGKKGIIDPTDHILKVDLETLRRNPEAMARAAEIVSDYPGFRPTSSDPERVVQEFIDFGTSNLLWLFDQVPADIVARSRLWYEGAHKIARRLAKKYGVPVETAAGVLAALSPQKDWYQNVSLAERVFKVYFKSEKRFHNMTAADDEKILATANRLYTSPKTKKLLPGIMDKPWPRMNADERALFIRAYDETYEGREYHTISPEGDLVGEPSGKAAWGSTAEISKAVQILMHRNRGARVIGEILGHPHKVRSFYNNIVNPQGAEDVTIDTHAVAAALLRPLSGNTIEVAQAMGGSLALKHKRKYVDAGRNVQDTLYASGTGLIGLNPLYAEMYRKAAKERKVLPREMQSITWEALRGLFDKKFKADRKKVNIPTVDNIWRKHENGDITAEAARQEIHDYAQGIDDPTWYERPDQGTADRTDGTERPADDAGDVAGTRVPRGSAGDAVARGRSRSTGKVPSEGVKYSLRRARDISEFTEVAPKPGGSNAGAIFEDKNGDRWLIKYTKPPQAKNEYVASAAYRMAGINSPEIELVNLGTGQLGVGVKWVDGTEPFNQDDPKHLQSAKKGFAVDAWLANWDTVGLTYDNMLVRDGSVVRIDPGGALEFRAQGEPKGDRFGDDVPEIDSMRQRGTAGAVFGDMTNEEVGESINILRKVADTQIRDIVENAESDPSLADRMIARKHWLLAWQNEHAPETVKLSDGMPKWSIRRARDVSQWQTVPGFESVGPVVSPEEFMDWWNGGWRAAKIDEPILKYLGFQTAIDNSIRGPSKIVNKYGEPRGVMHGSPGDVSRGMPTAPKSYVTRPMFFGFATGREFNETGFDPHMRDYEKRLTRRMYPGDVHNDFTRSDLAYDFPDAFIISTLRSLKDGEIDSVSAAEQIGWNIPSGRAERAGRQAVLALKAGRSPEEIAAVLRRMIASPKIYAAYLSAQNPYNFANKDHVKIFEQWLNNWATAENRSAAENFAQNMPTTRESLKEDYMVYWEGARRGGIERESLVEGFSHGNWVKMESSLGQHFLLSSGFDGFFTEESGYNVAVFHPSQVKSIFNPFEPGATREKRLSIRRSIPAASAPGTRVPPVSLNRAQFRADKLRYTDTLDWFSKVMKKTGMAPDKIGSAQGFVDDLFTKMQDKNIPLARFIDYIRDHGGRIEDNMDTYMKAELFGDKVVAAIKDRRGKYHIPLMQAVRSMNFTQADVDALAAISERVREVTTNGEDVNQSVAEAYLYARHAVERNAFLRNTRQSNNAGGNGTYESGLTDADANAVMAWAQASGRLNQLEAVGTKYDALIGDTNTTRHGAGLAPDWSKIQSDSDGNPLPNFKHYAPLRGWASDFMDDSDGNFMQSVGYTVRGREDPTMKGRRSVAGSVIEAAILQNEHAVYRAHRNEVANSLVNLIRANPAIAAQWAEITSVPMKRQIMNGVVRLVADHNYKNDPEVVIAKRLDDNGNVIEDIVHIHDAKLARVLGNQGIMGDESQATVIQAIGTVTRYLASVSTRFSPEFPVGNFLRDVQTGAINIQQYEIDGVANEMRKNLPGAFKGIREIIRETGDPNSYWAKRFKEFSAAGGQSEYLGLRSISQRVKALNREMNNAKPTTALGHGASLFRKTLKFVEDYNTILENTVRVAAFDAMLKVGASPERAAQVAKNLTVNFSKRGEWAWLNSLYMFYNASLQGSMAIMTAAARSRRVRRILGGIMVAGAMQELIMQMISPEDDDGEKVYNKVPEWQAEHSLIFMDPFGITGRGYLAIPMPYGYNAFHNAGRLAMKAMMGNMAPGDAAAGIVGGAVDAFNPIGGTNSFLNFAAPTILDPIVDLWTNEDFTGRNIYPEASAYSIGQPKSQLYWNSTEKSLIPYVEIAKGISSLSGGTPIIPGRFEVSPEQIKYAVEYVTGGVGKFVQRVTDFTFGTLPEAMMGDFEDISVGEIPFVRKFVGNVTTRNDLEQFIKNRDQILTINKEIEEAKKYGQPERIANVLENYPEAFASIPAMKAINNRRNNLLQKIRNIRRNPNIPSDRKDEIIDKLNAQVEVLVGQANKIVNRISERYQ